MYEVPNSATAVFMSFMLFMVNIFLVPAGGRAVYMCIHLWLKELPNNRQKPYHPVDPVKERSSAFSLSNMLFRLHTCLLHHRLPTVILLDFSEPNVKVLRRAYRLRDTDGDGVYAAIGRERMKGEL